MNLEIYDKTTLNRINIIRTFVIVQYTDYFNDIGTFLLKVPFTDKAKDDLMVHGNYIYFEEGKMGIIKYFKAEPYNSSILEVRGFLIKHILSYRSILSTKTYNGELFEIERQIVSDFFISNSDNRRNISLVTLDTNYPETESTSFQNTGAKVSDILSGLNDDLKYGYDLVPVITDFDSEEQNANISAFKFKTKKYADKSINNIQGNDVVLFSSNLNNISTFSYENDESEYCNVAVVAGEGEGSERTIVETGATIASGIDRIELYVDARDLQSETESGTTLTEAQYQEVLKNRGKEKLGDNAKYENAEAEVILNGNNSFVFGIDFMLGDIVTLEDDTLGIMVDVQITGITRTLTQEGDFTEPIFGLEKASIYKRVRQIVQ